MAGRIIAIGDIHGCAVALETLIAAMELRADDTVVSLGDVVDRGPDSRQAVDLLLRLRDRCTFHAILGNHEEMLLNVVRGEMSPMSWLQFGGVATLDSYGFSGDLSVIPEEHVEFMDNFSPYLELDDFIFTHANYDPELTLDQQPPSLLRWVSLIETTPGPHISGKKAVLGHTPDKGGEVFDIGHLVCVDTFCYGGQWLTALDLTSGRAWQANDEGQLRDV